MTAAGIEFRSYRQEDRDQVISLLAVGRHPDYARQKSAIFDWQFFGNPVSDLNPPFLVGTVDDAVVAINGFMPVKMRFRGKAQVGCWSLDTYVSASYRGRGFGSALIERVSLRAPVMLGFGFSDMSDSIFERQDWLRDAAMATLHYHVDESGAKGFGKNMLSRGARLIGSRKRRPQAATDVEIESAPAADELDALWQRVQSHYDNGVERNGPYLAWRYGASPTLRYRWVSARSGGELRGVLVTRHHPSESVIADYLGPADDADLLANLCEAAVSDLARAGTARVRCQTNHSAIKAALATTGFVPSRYTDRFRVRCNITPPLASMDGWFVMSGDSDNDLLVF